MIIIDTIDKPRQPYRFYNQPFSEPSEAKDSKHNPDGTDFETGSLPTVEIDSITEQNVPPKKEEDSWIKPEKSKSSTSTAPIKEPNEKWKTY